MITILLPYRNRDIQLVKRCLDSLRDQDNHRFHVFLVDYGSDPSHAEKTQRLVQSYQFVEYVKVPVFGQLWNKSRAINIGLKKCRTPYFLMADIDLIFHPAMISLCHQLMDQHKIVYFKYGFLNKKECVQEKKFEDYTISFGGSPEVTGTTLYQTDVLKTIKGYDEFYHGWGAEDTDVHLRLQNAGYNIYFYEEEILIKHQWHPKEYRSKASPFPFHTTLEQVNHQYMLLRGSTKEVVANTKFPWGIVPNRDQLELLQQPQLSFELTTEKNKIDAFLTGVFPELKKVLKVTIRADRRERTVGNRIRKMLKKKSIAVYSVETVNNRILEEIITNHRLASYCFRTDWHNGQIELVISPYVQT